MKGSWLVWVRKVHTFLSVFFTPLLLLFLLTGLWQMLVPEDIREENPGLEGLSTVHTDAFYPKAGVPDPATTPFKLLVLGLGIALTLSILLGLVLAWKHAKVKTWVILALSLGILVPFLVLWLA